VRLFQNIPVGTGCIRKQNQRQRQLRQGSDLFPINLERNQIQTDRAYQKTKRSEYDRTTDPGPFDGPGNGAVNKNEHCKNDYILLHRTPLFQLPFSRCQVSVILN